MQTVLLERAEQAGAIVDVRPGRLVSVFVQDANHDVRRLAVHLRTNANWGIGLHAYATERDHDFNTLNRIIGWLTDMYLLKDSEPACGH